MLNFIASDNHVTILKRQIQSLNNISFVIRMIVHMYVCGLNEIKKKRIVNEEL